MRKIIMLKSDKRLGFKKGEVYEVKSYWLDPEDKLSAIRKVPDDGIYGRDSGFNVYRVSQGRVGYTSLWRRVGMDKGEEMSYLKIPNLYKDQSILLFKKCYAMEKIHGTSAHISFNKIPQIVFGPKDETATIFPDKIEIKFFAGGENHENFVKLFNQEFLLSKFKEIGVDDMVVYGEA